MEPRWEVIRGAVTMFVCIVLLRIALSVWTECNEQIVAFLATMKDIGSEDSAEDRLWGLASFGLVIISVLALVRILARSK